MRKGTPVALIHRSPSAADFVCVCACLYGCRAGWLWIKYAVKRLATTPGPVRHLRMEEGVTSAEVLLQWDSIESESSVALRGYHAEAQETSVDELTASPPRLADASRTAQTMPSPKPSLKLRNLHGRPCQNVGDCSQLDICRAFVLNVF